MTSPGLVQWQQTSEVGQVGWLPRWLRETPPAVRRPDSASDRETDGKRQTSAADTRSGALQPQTFSSYGATRCHLCAKSSACFCCAFPLKHTQTKKEKEICFLVNIIIRHGSNGYVESEVQECGPGGELLLRIRCRGSNRLSGPWRTFGCSETKGGRGYFGSPAGKRSAPWKPAAERSERQTSWTIRGQAGGKTLSALPSASNTPFTADF